MKKKYRRAVCKSLVWLLRVRWIFCPIVLLAGIIAFGWVEAEKWDSKLERKFKVHDDDPD